MAMPTKLVVAGVVAAGLGIVSAKVLKQRVKYTLHVYDHCPFCNRVEFFMQHFGIAYKRVVYGYGAGANPDKCEGQGYGSGPLPLTGKKMLPVLVGHGVPCAEGAKGMPESMEICSFLVAKHNLVVPCDSGRDDVKKCAACGRPCRAVRLLPVDAIITKWCHRSLLPAEDRWRSTRIALDSHRARLASLSGTLRSSRR